MRAPETISRIENKGIQISWPRQQPCFLTAKVLRDHCPSAVSQAKRGDLSHDQPIIKKQRSALSILDHDQKEQLTLEAIWAVGNYAIGMRWADGHDSGIYPFSLLADLSKEFGEELT